MDRIDGARARRDPGCGRRRLQPTHGGRRGENPRAPEGASPGLHRAQDRRAPRPGRQAHGRRRPGRVRRRLVCAPPFHRMPRTLSLPQRGMVMSTPSSSPTRRDLLVLSAAAGAASLLPASAGAATGGDAIRPFSINVPEEELVDLRRRIAATRWPEKETVADQSQGVQLATIQELARYWATDYDWRKMRGETERPAAIHHRDRWARHSFHSRSFET